MDRIYRLLGPLEAATSEPDGQTHEERQHGGLCCRGEALELGGSYLVKLHHQYRLKTKD